MAGEVRNESQTKRAHMALTHAHAACSRSFVASHEQMSIDTVKTKLCSHTGSNPSAMVLQLKDDRGALMATLTDPYKPLGFYSPFDGCARCKKLLGAGSVCARGSACARAGAVCVWWQAV